MAFSLGLTIAQTHLKMRIKILAVAIFSLATPIGIAIGIGVTDMQEVCMVLVVVNSSWKEEIQTINIFSEHWA